MLEGGARFYTGNSLLLYTHLTCTKGDFIEYFGVLAFD